MESFPIIDGEYIRSHSGIGMNGLSPKQKLEKLGIINAKKYVISIV